MVREVAVDEFREGALELSAPHQPVVHVHCPESRSRLMPCFLKGTDRTDGEQSPPRFMRRLWSGSLRSRWGGTLTFAWEGRDTIRRKEGKCPFRKKEKMLFLLLRGGL